MFRELLVWLIPKRHPGRRWAVRTTDASIYEPLCNTMLSEVYHAHAAIHGGHKLLPGEALFEQSASSRTGETGSNPTVV